MKFIYLFPLILMLTSIINEINSVETLTYSTTWATSLYQIRFSNLVLKEKTLRQIIHVSSSAQIMRLKLSNKFGKTGLEIKSINIADSKSQGTGEIISNTITPIQFKGEDGVVIPPGEEIYSDIFTYSLKTLSEVAITIYFGSVPEEITGHDTSMTYSFIEEGNSINNDNFSTENKIPRYFFISLLEIVSKVKKSCVVCFGDSITDGMGSKNDKHNRYPDFLSMKLKLNKDTSYLSVVNEGISGSLLTTQGIERFSHDVLQIKGVKYIVFLYGVNDLNFLDSTYADIIFAYQKLITLAHEKNILIYGSTILPYGKNGIWTEAREKTRRALNNWIRTTKSEDGGFDAIFDFDEYIKDPDDETKMKDIYDSGDGLNPNSEGYERMVQAIDDLDLFTKEPKFNYYLDIYDKIGIKFKLDFYIEENDGPYIYIKGKCEENNGFRIALYNDNNEKVSDYFYSGKLQNSYFEFSIILKAKKKANYIIIRRPISTINLDNISFSHLEINTLNDTQIFNFENDGEFI